MTNKLMVVKEDATIEWCTNDYPSIREAIGNLIEVAMVNEVASYYVDEEGVINGRVLNLAASMAAGRLIFGTAVCIHAETDEEGNTLPPPPDWLQFVTHICARVNAMYQDADALNQDIRVRANPDTLPPARIIALPEDWVPGDPFPEVDE